MEEPPTKRINYGRVQNTSLVESFSSANLGEESMIQDDLNSSPKSVNIQDIHPKINTNSNNYSHKVALKDKNSKMLKTDEDDIGREENPNIPYFFQEAFSSPQFKRKSMLFIGEAVRGRNRLNRENYILEKIMDNPRVEAVLRRCLRRRQELNQIKKDIEAKKLEELKADFNNKEKEALLTNAISGLTNDERNEKASDYFQDALYNRKIRYSFPSRKIRFIYHLQTHTYWSGWITLLVWIYIFLTFFEPTHSESRPFSQLDDSWWICITTEFSVLLFFTFDAILEIIHRKHDNERPTSKHFWKNCKFIFKYFVDVNLLIDAILFWIFYEHGIPYFRYGRLLRPLKLITLSRELRRFSKAIMQTLPYIIDVVILFILVCFIFAILGVKILEDVQGDMKEGELREENNFSTIGKAINTLWILITLENYPDAMRPYVDISPYYFLYFFPFIFISLIFLLPIPVCIVFDTFRRKRSDLMMKDSLREKEAIYAVFVCLDTKQQGYLVVEQWNEFMRKMYNGHDDPDRVAEVFNQFDLDGNELMDMFEFFEACDLVLAIGDLALPYLCNPSWWQAFRDFCNNKLKLKIIVTSVWFELFILFVVLINIVILVLYAIYDDEETQETLDLIDRILLSIYIAEVILKLIGLGIVDYFNDHWNKFDFSLVIISLFLDFSISLIKVAKTSKSAKTAKFAKLSRSQKSLKVMKSFRSIRAARILNAGMATFIRIKLMIQRTLLCFPAVKKLLTLLTILSYIYSCIGMESFQKYEKTVYHDQFFGHFESFGMSLAVMFQILTLSNWHAVVFHYATTNNYTGSIFFFYSFQMITVVILLSLVTGLIWEVFTILNQEGADILGRDDKQETEEAERNEERGSENASVIHSNNNDSPKSNKEKIILSYNQAIYNTAQYKRTDSNRSSKSIRSQQSLAKSSNSPRINVRSTFHNSSKVAQTTSGKAKNSLKPTTPQKQITFEGDEHELERKRKPVSGIKSQYLLRKALLKHRNIKEEETTFLKNSFQAYNKRVEKVEIEAEAPKVEELREINGGILMLRTVRFLRQKYIDTSIFTELKPIYMKLQEMCPIGSCISLVFGRSTGYPCILPAGEDSYLEFDFKTIKLALEGLPSLHITKVANFYSQNEDSPVLSHRFNGEKISYQEQMIKCFAKMASIQNRSNLQLESYNDYSWTLFVGCIEHEGDLTKIKTNSRTLQKYGNEVESPRSSEDTERICYNNRSRQNSAINLPQETITKGYLICIIPATKSEEEERKMALLAKVAENWMAHSFKKYTEKVSMPLADVKNYMSDFMCVLEHFRPTILKQATDFLHNANYLSQSPSPSSNASPIHNSLVNQDPIADGEPLPPPVQFRKDVEMSMGFGDVT